MAPRIANLAEWRHHLLERLERHVAASGDADLDRLLAELREYPAPELEAPPAPRGLAAEIFATLRLRTAGGAELAFFSTVTTFGTAIDITVAELAIEAFFPADAATATALASLPRK